MADPNPNPNLTLTLTLTPTLTRTLTLTRWWRAFLNTATTGLYFLAYALYYSAELQLSGGVSRVLYFGYMSAAALSLGLMTGTVGLAAAYLFVVSVYAKIRVD